MPKLTANSRAIKSAINGEPAVYAIERHDRLYLDVWSKGRAAWRIRYRPKPNANQRWFTLAEDARNAPFDEIADKATTLLNALRLHGIDPHAEREAKAAKDATPAGHTVETCFKAWLDHTGKRRGRSLSRATRAGYDSLFNLHVMPHLGAVPITELDRAAIDAAIAKVKAATSNTEKNQRGV